MRVKYERQINRSTGSFEMHAQILCQKMVCFPYVYIQKLFPASMIGHLFVNEKKVRRMRHKDILLPLRRDGKKENSKICEIIWIW